MAITRITSPAITGLTIPNTSINNASLNSVTALPSGITTGKVLKASAKEFASTVNTSSSSFVSAFDFTNVTPSGQNSKYLIQLMGGYTTTVSDKYMSVRILVAENSGTASVIQSANNRDWTSYQGANNAYLTSPHSWSYLYTPTNTSSLTRLDFNVQFASKNTSGTVTFNTGSYAGGALDGGVTLSVIEIA